jgi:hypothetical protein
LEDRWVAKALDVVIVQLRRNSLVHSTEFHPVRAWTSLRDRVGLAGLVRRGRTFAHSEDDDFDEGTSSTTVPVPDSLVRLGATDALAAESY